MWNDCNNSCEMRSNFKRLPGTGRTQFRVSVFLGRKLFSAYESHLFNIDTSFKKSDYSGFFLFLSSIPILVPGNEAQKLYFHVYADI